MKTILALSLVAVTVAQPWSYHHSIHGPLHYAGSHLTPTVYNTYYPVYYYPYAWRYGVNVAQPVHQYKAYVLQFSSKFQKTLKEVEKESSNKLS